MLSALNQRIWNLLPAGLRGFYSGIRCPEHRPMKMTLAEHYIYKGQEGADLIARMLKRGEPCLVTRFGWNEIAVVMHYLKHCRRETVVYPAGLREAMQTGAGFFPPTDEKLSRFAYETLRLLPEIDILGVTGRRGEERLIRSFNPAIRAVDINCVVDHATLAERPWTWMLKGKKVLVIHPFAETIRSQYARRELLFPGRDVLPEFELITLKAVQSCGILPHGFPYTDWFGALESMCREIEGIEYDIALIGAGAYGMFLGAFCKRCGRQAVHMGGALQLLFGIRGTRWERQYPPEFGARLFNPHWVSPSPSERPEGYRAIEDGCYW